MSNAGVKLDNNLLAHMALHHLPREHRTTRQVIIATAEPSDIALTLDRVLSQINELVLGVENYKSTATALNTRAKTTGNRTYNYKCYTNGSHTQL